MNSRINGFTLVELMIAVAIIGILTAIAVPSYQESMRKSRRADAQGALMNFANGMERLYTENSTYCGGAQAGNDVCGDGAFDTGIPFPTVFAPTGQTGNFYDFRIIAATQNTYTLQASPNPANAQVGDGVLELDPTRIRRWDRNNNLTIMEADENTWD
ncbi:MAG: prepilin-type N-terminal cleavage/methylation domain-containing protein [Methylococcaceae bacterium]|nr:prepilin-type N-terminal cleavage/methylation domain-containing protein [Methylococcaceae bacterium]